MRSRFLSATLAPIVLAGLGTVQAQDEVMEMPQPGAQHKYLARWAGCWDVSFFFTPNPGAEEVETRGRAWSRSSLGGFWMIGDIEGEIGNQPYRGHSIHGYNPFTKKSVYLGFDNWGDYYVHVVGPLDMKSGTMTGYGDMEVMGVKMKVKQVLELPDVDTQRGVFSVSGSMGEQTFDFTPMTMTMKRIEGPSARPASAKQGIEPATLSEGVKLSKQHELLKRFAGNWDADIEMMGRKFKGEMVWTLGYGGLWLILDFKADFMGREFQGHGMVGYDSTRKSYVGAWVDSWTPAMMLTTGALEDGVFTENGTVTNPANGETMRTRHTSRFLDDNTIEWQMFDVNEDGAATITMKITYKRKGAPK